MPQKACCYGKICQSHLFCFKRAGLSHYLRSPAPDTMYLPLEVKATCTSLCSSPSHLALNCPFRMSHSLCLQARKEQCWPIEAWNGREPVKQAAGQRKKDSAQLQPKVHIYWSGTACISQHNSRSVWCTGEIMNWLTKYPLCPSLQPQWYYLDWFWHCRLIVLALLA